MTPSFWEGSSNTKIILPSLHRGKHNRNEFISETCLLAAKVITLKLMKRLHFIGIAGHTMAGLALAAKQNGYEVTGLDETAYPTEVNYSAQFLDKNQIKWWRVADVKHIDGVDGVVVSGGTKPDHVELGAARAAKIPIKSFAQLWGELTADHYRIVVTGTHGKTTTTSLIAWVLEVAGNRPDFLIGITPKNFPASVRLVGSKVAVTEGDEYQSSQLDATSKFDFYHPDAAVITSIEHDHPDVFPDLASVVNRFRVLVKAMPTDGRLYYWQEEATVRELVKMAPCTTIGYGLSLGDWQAEKISFDPTGLRFEVTKKDVALGEVIIPLFGTHNVLNTLAALAVTSDYGVAWPIITKALIGFKGASRRFERVTGPSDQVQIIDDYAHHPTAAATTIAAVKLHFPGRLIAVYQPHTYSRTTALLAEYRQAFAEADETFLLPIEGARERHLEATVSSDDIALGAAGRVHSVASREALIEAVSRSARPGDTVLCMSVGGCDNLAQELAVKLQEKSA